MSAFPDHLHATVLARLGELSLAARQAVESSLSGRHRSVRRGLSVEFAAHRPYLPGDDLRHLDWHVWARHDRLDVRQYEEETRLRCTLVVDASGSMDYGAPGPTKLDQARILAAATAYLLVRDRDAVGCAVADGRDAPPQPPGSTMGHLLHLFQRLEDLRPAGDQELAPLLEQLAPTLARRGLVVVLTDGFCDPDRLVAGLRLLRHRRQEVRLWQVLHRDELDLPWSGGCLFSGCEGEAPLRLDADRMRVHYRTAFAAHQRTVAEGCHAAGITVDTVLTDEDPALALVRLIEGQAGLAAGLAGTRP